MQHFHHTLYTTSYAGLVRGQEVVDTGAPIMVPVGPGTLGRILNVIGEPVDEQVCLNVYGHTPSHHTKCHAHHRS
ncbi:hypothetical protein EON63_05340 [archaeon]|nr:MAG: hypothetical protein EON63_05340 [archaeon]